MKTETQPLIAYHNSPELKEKFLARVRAHRAADELIKGATEGRRADGSFKGCAVVCTLARYKHAGYETELGVPRILARLEDGIFERLPDANALDWPEQFLSAIPVGADLTQVADRFLLWLLVDETDGVILFAKTARVKKAIQAVADLYVKKLAGERVTRETWQSARADADADAADAADAARAGARAKTLKECADVVREAIPFESLGLSK